MKSFGSTPVPIPAGPGGPPSAGGQADVGRGHVNRVHRRQKMKAPPFRRSKDPHIRKRIGQRPGDRLAIPRRGLRGTTVGDTVRTQMRFDQRVKFFGIEQLEPAVSIGGGGSIVIRSNTSFVRRRNRRPSSITTWPRGSRGRPGRRRDSTRRPF